MLRWLVLLVSFCYADETFVKSGSTITVLGIGEGSSVELARHAAEKSCIISASDAVNKSINVKSISVQTEKGAWINDDVEYSQKVKGLKYEVAQERIEEKEDAYRVRIQCKFDLTKVSLIDENIKEEKNNTYISSQRLVSVSVSPVCDSILVQGKNGRSIACTKNPVTFIAEPGDSSLIVRAKNFKTATVVLTNNNSIGANYVVVLDR